MSGAPTRLPLQGAGIGLRRDLLDELEDAPVQVSFMELAPENWINVGSALNRRLRGFAERYPLVCHGLSLSLGGREPLDKQLLGNIKNFLDEHRVCCYSEHLSYCADEGHLYDLMPIPFTAEAVRHVAARIREVQDFLERRIAVENVSAYIALGGTMDETDFLNRVLEEADCNLLLDVNNVYVNSVNFGFDPREYLAQIPAERIAYCHVAGHDRRAQDMIVDTHGAAVAAPVWDLLEEAYSRLGVFPTLLERDFNFPESGQLFDEIARIKALQKKWRTAHAA